jgi:ribosome-binding protein aMBF1 (putative translation factor)
MKTPESAPKPVAQPSRSTVTLRFTESEAIKHGLLDRWQAVMRRREARAKKIQDASEQLSALVSGLLQRAEAERWSQRTLAKKIGIPETTFRRIRAQQVDPFLWLPKLRATIADVKP